MVFRSKDCITSYVVIALSGLLYIGSFWTRQMLAMTAGPAFMPKLLSVLMLILGVALFVRTQIKERDMPKREKTATPQRVHKSWKTLLFDEYGQYTLWVVMVLYAFSMQKLGFIISSSLMLFISFWMLSPRKEKKPFVFAVSSVLLSVGIFYLFTEAFLLMLPPGILE